MSRTAPSVYWGETPLLATASFEWGIAHPPGYALYLNHLWAWTHLPFGTPAYRANCASAFWGAVTVILYGWLVARITASALAGILAGIGLALYPSFMEIALVAEVYTFHLAGFSALWLAWLRWQERPGRQRGALVGMLAGLNLAHHLTIGFLLLPLALVSAWEMARGRFPWKKLWLMACFVLPGIMVLLYFPVRSELGCFPNWGNPNRWDWFLNMVTARDELVPSAAMELGRFGMMWYWMKELLGETVGGLGVPLSLLTVLGLGGGVFRRIKGWELPVLIFLTSWLMVAMYATNERATFFLPGVMVVLLFAGWGIKTLQSFHYGQMAAGLALAAALGAEATAQGTVHRENVWYVHEFGRRAIETFSSRTVVFLQESDKYFLLYYLRRIEQTDSPKILYFQRLLNLPWFFSQLYYLPPPGIKIPYIDPKAFEDSAEFNALMVATLIRANYFTHEFGSLDPLDPEAFPKGFRAPVLAFPSGWGYWIDQAPPGKSRGGAALSFFKDLLPARLDENDPLSAEIFAKVCYDQGVSWHRFGWGGVSADYLHTALGFRPVSPVSRQAIEDLLAETEEKKPKGGSQVGKNL